MDASITAIRRIQAQPGYALITILFELAISVCEAFAERQRRATARNELRRLSDRALKDIGLERAEIDGMFR
jgi:uncharacterized protein YjiS (DUF1127 family)